MDEQKKRKDTVLADGELTGHKHVALGENVEVFGEGVRRLLAAPKGATVVHEEHSKLELPAGKFSVGRVQEFDYEQHDRRNVAD